MVIIYCRYGGKNGKDQLIPGILMFKICDSPLIQPKIRGKKIGGMFLIFITFQIVNLKTIGDVLGFRKCYQCDGETDPVKHWHSVSDSIFKFKFRLLLVFLIV